MITLACAPLPYHHSAHTLAGGVFSMVLRGEVQVRQSESYRCVVMTPAAEDALVSGRVSSSRSRRSSVGRPNHCDDGSKVCFQLCAQLRRC
jgi:hypothetical protein